MLYCVLQHNLSPPPVFFLFPFLPSFLPSDPLAVGYTYLVTLPLCRLVAIAKRDDDDDDEKRGGEVGKEYREGVSEFFASASSMRLSCNTKFNVTVVVVVCFTSLLACWQ